MLRLRQRKTLITILFTLLILGGIFGIRFFTSASKPQPSSLWETQTLHELSAQFTTSKLGNIQLPTVTVASALHGTVTTIPFSTGENVKGGQPLLQLADQLGLYTLPLESSQLLLDSTQSLYDKTLTDFSTVEQQAALDITNLQLQLKQIEQDLQTVIIQRRDQLSTPSTPIEECTDETCIPLIITEPQECTDETCLSPTIEATTETNLLQQSLLQSLSDTEQLLEKEKLNYELLKTTHSTQLSDLEHSLQSTRKDYEIAYTTYNKLTIRSPLAGTIQDLFVSIGDTVEEGTPLFSLLPHTSIPTIEVQLSFEEYLTILTTPNVSIILPPATVKTTPGNLVLSGPTISLSALDTPELFLETFVFNNTETGNIISRSSTTNENGNYTITIEPTNQSVPLLRETALQQQKDGNLIPLEIQFPLETSGYYLPVSVVDIINQTSGFLYLLVEGQVQKFPVDLGNQRNNFIEITTPLNPATPVITNRGNY